MRAASRNLRTTGLHPFIDQLNSDGRLPTPWAEGGWRVYFHDAAEILRTIGYVEQNPEKRGVARRWITSRRMFNPVWAVTA